MWNENPNKAHKFECFECRIPKIRSCKIKNAENVRNCGERHDVLRDVICIQVCIARFMQIAL